MDSVVQHQRLALVAVKPEEFKKRMQALLVMEEFCGQVAVKELHAVTDRLVESWAREGGSEGLEVQLKNEVGIRTSINKLLLEAQVLGSLQLFYNKSMDIDTKVLPNTRPWTNCQSNSGRQNNCFLSRSKNFSKSTIS